MDVIVYSSSKSFYYEYYIYLIFIFVCLLGTLERNPFINLAHINPERFHPVETQPQDTCSLFFIGLEFAKGENLNVNLTFDIQNFTEQVNRHAANITLLKDGMRLEARHVRRKMLNQYISPLILKRERKLSALVIKNGATDGAATTLNSPTSGGPTTVSRKRSLDQVDTNSNKKSKSDDVQANNVSKFIFILN